MRAARAAGRAGGGGRGLLPLGPPSRLGPRLRPAPSAPPPAAAALRARAPLLSAPPLAPRPPPGFALPSLPLSPGRDFLFPRSSPLSALARALAASPRVHSHYWSEGSRGSGSQEDGRETALPATSLSQPRTPSFPVDGPGDSFVCGVCVRAGGGPPFPVYKSVPLPGDEWCRRSLAVGVFKSDFQKPQVWVTAESYYRPSQALAPSLPHPTAPAPTSSSGGPRL